MRACVRQHDCRPGLSRKIERLESLTRQIPFPVTYKKSLRFITSPAALLSVDLRNATAEPSLNELSASWPQQNVQRLNCFAVWAEVALAPAIKLSTLETSSWSATAYRIEPFRKKQGDLEFRLALTAHTNHWSARLDHNGAREEHSYSPEIAATDLLAFRSDAPAEIRSASDSAISLRPIAPADIPFLQRVYASTREEELAPVPWNAEQKTAFLTMQFNAQHQDYHSNYPSANFDIIVRDGAPIGRLYVDRRPMEICLLDIALLPEYRGSGIGGTLMRQLINEADHTGKALVIYVEKFNRAQNLYRRLGFKETEDTGVYLRMERPRSAP